MQTIKYTIDICRMVSLSLHRHLVSLSELWPGLCDLMCIFNTTNILQNLAFLSAHLLLHLVKGLRVEHLLSLLYSRKAVDFRTHSLGFLGGRSSDGAKGTVAVSGTVAVGQWGIQNIQNWRIITQNHQTRIGKIWLEVMAWILGGKFNYCWHVRLIKMLTIVFKHRTWWTCTFFLLLDSMEHPPRSIGKVRFEPSVPPISHPCTRAHPCDTPRSPATISSRVYLGMPHDASPAGEGKNNYTIILYVYTYI